ncbi:T9SS type A sorting domain-containing protein [Flavobacterium longum]|uniref:T9SS type A sorting domain-containing protein n=1 Tax=Flavobacterium longum TaxID=1299340 RepID=UPI0039EB2795
MKRTITLLGAMLVCCISMAQNPDWTWGRNYESFNQESRSLTAADQDGNVYLIGNFQSASITVGSNTFTNGGMANTGDIYLAKFDTNGNLLWAKKDGGAGFDMVYIVATDGLGNVLVAGSFNTAITFGTTTLTHGGVGNFLVKYDPDGNVLWAKRYAAENESLTTYRVKTDALGNIYMTGYYTSPQISFDGIVLTNFNYDEAIGNGTPFLVKLDENGNTVWAKGAQRSGSTNFQNISSDLAIDGSGNVFIGGYFFSETIQFDLLSLTNPSFGQPRPNVFMVKYDASGNTAWARTVTPGSFQNNFIFSVNADNAGNSYFGGTFTSSITIDDTTLTASSSGNKMFVLKLDGSGNVVWGRTASSNGYSGVDCADTDADGNLYVGGTFNGSSINFGSGNVNVADQSGNFFVTKYNASNGSIGWVRLGGPTNINNRISIDCKNQNELYVGAFFFSNTITLGNITLQKTATTGYNILVAKLNYTPLGLNDVADADLMLWPNPATTSVTVENLSPESAFDLYDNTGKKVTSGIWQDTTELLDTDGLPTGVYLLKVSSSQGETVVKKIVKE